MNFIYDEKKNIANKIKHGINLEEAITLWEQDHIIIPAKNVLGENRWAIVGLIHKKIYICIFTFRNDSIRIISCHRADTKLERIFYEKTKKQKKD